nr:hypothetical protein [Ramlibacter aurantiacus]
MFQDPQKRDPSLTFGAPTADAAPGSALAPGELVFDTRQANNANLLFGEGTGPDSGTFDLAITGKMPALTLQAEIAEVINVRVVGRMPGLQMLAEVQYLTNTQRPTVGETTHEWHVTMAAGAGITQLEQDTDSLPAGWAAGWDQANDRTVGTAVRMPNTMDRTPVERVGRFKGASRAHLNRATSHHVSTRMWKDRTASFQTGTNGGSGGEFRHQDGDRQKFARRDARHQVAQSLRKIYGTDFQPAMPLPKGWQGQFQGAAPPPIGSTPGPVIGKPTPIEPPVFIGPANLLFQFPFGFRGTNILFGDLYDSANPEKVPAVISVRRVYIVVNIIRLYRVPDDAPVPALNLSLSLDADSWTWGFNASLPAAAQALVEPVNGPVELRALVNGTEFRVLAENISRERTFGEASIRISGRGHNAVLAAPYAPVMTFSNAQGRTARQLMDDVLTLNGIPLGWTVDWGLIDWNVPAGAFSRQGTWIEALASIAGAAGGYLLPHASAKELRVRHRYPTAPWQWNTVTPDYVLPVDAVARESLRWIEKPTYNRVFVSGQDVGVLGQVTRAGTAGDVLAPMVVDALITEAAAARQRGLAVLADTGPQFEVSLRLPVLDETGIIEPGAFVEYLDGSVTRRGLVRSTQVEAGMPEVWQTLGVQGHA